jgi:hypothetical protein
MSVSFFQHSPKPGTRGIGEGEGDVSSLKAGKKSTRRY